jgi:alkylation response protein AidB-like acyl-CoA dehydrogenase
VPAIPDSHPTPGAPSPVQLGHTKVWKRPGGRLVSGHLRCERGHRRITVQVVSNPNFSAYQPLEEHTELRAALRSLCEKEIAPHAADVDEHARFPTEAREALTAAGFHAVHLPTEYGGDGADAVAGCIVIEEVARVCASSSLIPAVNKLGSSPLLMAGSDELKKQVLPSVAAGEAMMSYALSERESGSDAVAMKTRARLDGDHWVLNGGKAWITNAGVSDWYTVFAMTDPEKGAKGVSAFVVHRDDPGFEVGPKERKLGIKGSPTCEIYFSDCTIPADRVIGEPGTGFTTAMTTFDHTRPTIGAQAVGIAQGALDASVEYTRDRRQFGKSIAEFQGVQFMLADMAMRIESARQLVYVAAAKVERGEKDMTFFASAAKCHASDVAMAVTVDAVQLFGGAGYTQDFPVERMMRDAKITQIYEGTNQVQRLVMARQLLRKAR